MAGKLKRLVLQVAAGVLYYSGVLRFRLFFRRVILRKREVCVLGLHRVLSPAEEAQANSLGGIVMREATFARVLEFLSREFHLVSLKGFLGGSEGGQSEPRPSCLLTFDDGWHDNYTTAFPLLREFGMPAVIFLTTGLVGACETFWVEQLKRACSNPSRRQRIKERFQDFVGTQCPEVDFDEIVESLKHIPASERNAVLPDLVPEDEKESRANNGDRMLDWEEVTAMQRDGIEFEAHTVTHPLLVYEDEASVRHELVVSKQAIEERLGKQVKAFAYPNGTWDERVRKIVQESGYECAFTTQRGWYCQGQDRYTIPRILLHEAQVTGINGRFSPALLSLRLSGWR